MKLWYLRNASTVARVMQLGFCFMRKISAVFLGSVLSLVALQMMESQTTAAITPESPCLMEGARGDGPKGQKVVCAEIQGKKIWVPRGGDLVVAISQDPGSLNPAATTAGAVHTASELMFNGLVELDDKLNPVPELAESWTVNKKATIYTFKLRREVKWHDGQPFTSADVKFTFDEVLLKYHSRTRASMLSALATIYTPNSHTVEFIFKESYGPLLLQLDVTEAPILPAHIYRGSDPTKNPTNLAPVGTGPFKFGSYARGSEIVLNRNSNYFRKGKPYLDRVIMRVIPNSATQVASFESGSVDFLWGVPGPDRARLLAQKKAFDTLITRRNPGGANCMMTVSFNLRRPITSNLAVRQAIFHSLNRNAFLQNVIFGEGSVAVSPFSKGIVWAWGRNLKLPEYNTTKANALLDSAGWTGRDGSIRTAQQVVGVANGSKLSIDFLHFPTFATYGELYKAQLKEVGIDVRLRPLESGPFATAVFNNRDFDSNIISYCNGNDPEIGIRRMYDSAQIGPVAFSNAAAYTNVLVDSTFQQARNTLDISKRQSLYQEIQEQLVKDVPYGWLVETKSTRIFTSRCGGFRPYSLFAEEAYCIN
jgi:peptide/nickel transport system substrate-binding protein